MRITAAELSLEIAQAYAGKAADFDPGEVTRDILAPARPG